MVLNRDFPPCDFTLVESEAAHGLLEISNERLHLTYDRGSFTTQGLSVQAKGPFSHHSVWRYGVPSPDLCGTAPTPDGVGGRIPPGIGGAHVRTPDTPIYRVSPLGR